MPRASIKDLQASLEAVQAEARSLREANEQLRRQLAGPPPAEPGRTLESHCPICFQALSDFDATLDCGHEFCRPCCTQHFAANATCPICRAPASAKELWRFRHPQLARYWHLLQGSEWPRAGDPVCLVTRRETLAGVFLAVSDEAQTLTLVNGLSAWEIPLANVTELFTLQHLLDQLAPREDGLVRRIGNAN